MGENDQKSGIGDLDAIPIHATGFQIAVDASDVTLIFKGKTLRFKEGDQSPEPAQHFVAAISLSHIIAKDLRNILDGAIKEFESQFGEIADLLALKHKQSKK